MNESTKLNYVEFASLNLAASKTFFTSAFSWCFTDYGRDYSAFSNAGLDGGIFAAEQVTQAESGAPLLVLYAPNISDAQHQDADREVIVHQIYHCVAIQPSSSKPAC